MDRAIKILQLVRLATASTCFVVFALLALKLNKEIVKLDVVLQHSDDTVLQLQHDLHSTSQNANAILLQAGLAANEARLASMEQRVALAHDQAKLGLVLDNANRVMLSLDATAQDADRSAVSLKAALDGLPPIEAGLLRLTEDEDIRAGLANLNRSSANVARATDSAANSMEVVEAKLRSVTKPASTRQKIVNVLTNILRITAWFY